MKVRDFKPSGDFVESGERRGFRFLLSEAVADHGNHHEHGGCQSAHVHGLSRERPAKIDGNNGVDVGMRCYKRRRTALHEPHVGGESDDRAENDEVKQTKRGFGADLGDVESAELAAERSSHEEHGGADQNRGRRAIE